MLDVLYRNVYDIGKDELFYGVETRSKYMLPFYRNNYPTWKFIGIEMFTVDDVVIFFEPTKA